MRKMRLRVFNNRVQVFTAGKRWSQDLYPGVSALQTLCPRDARASSRLGVPDRLTHLLLIEGYKQ